ncbi:hypothetical protein thalar_01121 [Litoreibacter arenae DSM 19593]|uniref:Uncharacterized protein n=1 Tax=Litoreibacter arenae DSM 19593 TaxID=1123360 RepID=S9S401_9RHOB|nr:hypothetical protein thalar_01121 [Litoreibacter arenae DSM 19593]
MVVDQLAERISALLREKLGIRGPSLEAQTRRAGRTLPRHVRRAALALADAERMAQAPTMRLRLDPGQVSAAYDTCLRYLEGVDEKALKSKAFFGFASTVIVQIVVVAGVAITVLRWRGYI